jgi:hypothetical protein
MKRLLHAHAYALGISSGDVISDSENMSDGGCDTEIRCGSESDSAGYCLVPTCWQFKGTKKHSVTDAMMRREVKKPYAKKLIEAGYGYRLAIADDFPAEEAQRREEVLAAEIKKINPSAPPPKVLSATMLGQWASFYFALILRIRGIKGFMPMAAWGESVRSDTKIFVPNARWEPVQTWSNNTSIFHSVRLRSVFRFVVTPGWEKRDVFSKL